MIADLATELAKGEVQGFERILNQCALLPACREKRNHRWSCNPITNARHRCVKCGLQWYRPRRISDPVRQEIEAHIARLKAIYRL